MKQWDAVNSILPYICKDKAIRAVFLKGSIARGDIDEYSDVDFYCLVSEDEQEDFLKRRIGYMENYRPLIYTSEANFVGPQVVGVFDNGLHFDLYTVTQDTLKRTDEVKILYDPEELLKDYVPEKLGVSGHALAEYFNEISFTLLEFEAAYCRGDLVWASRLGSHISGDLSIILRNIYDSDNAKLGMKRLNRKMDKVMLERYSKAMDLLGPSYLPQGVVILIDIMGDIIVKLPEEAQAGINVAFFEFMASRIRSLG